MNRLEQSLKTFLAELIRWALRPPAQPGTFALVVTGEEVTGSGEIIMRKNITTITLPEVAAGNPEGVKVRKFSVVSGADSLFAQDLPLADGAVNVDPVVLKLPQGVETVLTLIDVDAAGNESKPDVFTFTPTDVTPPSMPGAFQMSVSGEVDE